MKHLGSIRGEQELRAARSDQNNLLFSVGLFSIFANLLQLTGSLYMLQVYDRVLGSRSEATLVALTALIILMYICMGIIDNVRSRIMAIVGARMQDKLDRRVFSVALRCLMQNQNDATAVAAQRDLEAIQRLWASPALLAIFDIPWIPVFMIAIFAFHPYLGILSLVGAGVLISLSIANQIVTKSPQAVSNNQSLMADHVSDLIRSESEMVQALGMTNQCIDRWQKIRNDALVSSIAASDKVCLFSSLSKSFRLFLQSAMLGLGAWLVIRGELSSGAMIASSILMGRALAPVEQAISQWALVSRAHQGWARLASLLSRVPEMEERTCLPVPKGRLVVQNLSIIPPGSTTAALRSVSFELLPGQAVGIIGPSGAGKSTLARAIVGVWRPSNGTIRLDGAGLDQYDPDTLGSYIGYLPQRVVLFDGTIAENIARLHSKIDSAKVVKAAKHAAAHEMIVELPDGYNTHVNQLGGRLSGGQIQRIGLARALYGDPILLVLDEPNSNLDSDGSVAMNIAIHTTKSAGGSVLIIAHRPAAIQECDLLLVLETGMRRAFGSRDVVLREMVKNHAQVTTAARIGSVA